MGKGSIPQIKIKNLDVSLGWALRRAAQEIGTKIQDDYEAAITHFYSHYTPRWYKRTYSLYEGAIGVGGRGKYIKKSGRYGYDCGIEVGAEFYSYNPYGKDPQHGKEMTPEIVFPDAFEHGRHGFSTYTVRMVRANSKKKYWKLKRKYVPRNSTPPMTILNRSFKEIDNGDYVYNQLYAALDAVGAFIEIE